MRGLVFAQGGYYVVSGLWPLLHLESFLAVTGPKAEIWLVHMVALLTVVIGSTLLVACRRSALSLEIFLLALFSALAYAAVDLCYGFRDVLAPLYPVEGVFELLLAAGLLYCRVRRC